MHRLDPYIIAQELSRTEHVVLYRGHHADTGAPVLLQVSVGEHPSPRVVERQRHAFAIARRLSGPGVIQPIELLAHGHGVTLVFADPGGEPLRALLDRGRGRLVLAAALAVGASLASVAAAVHAQGVVHKDIHPGNIFVDEATGATHLTGFELATRLSSEALPMTSGGALEGALPYLAPEQTGRMSRAIDHRCDLYAVGAVLYEALTAAPPFSADDPLELVHALLARTPASPRERAPEIPAVVSDIVMKLLAKSPEDRYQHGRGLERDLRECAARLRATGAIAPFPLGRGDPVSELRIPDRLYGREHEIATLMDAFRRASAGAPQLVLVSGYSGIGKSQLVSELHREVARTRGHFAAGKFEELNRSVPYLAVADALSSLVRQILGEREASLARYREEILRAAGGSGRVLTDLVPGLERIIGPQPPVAELPPAAARSRFTILFQGLLRALTADGRPLVLFLDDLQWADLASLELLEVILAAPGHGPLLVIGAYRSNEVDAAHPLTRALERASASAAIHRIELPPLPREAAAQLIADALQATPEDVADLASIVIDKTLGNPFFLIQFLKALHRDGLLVFDADRLAFRYEAEQIRARMAEDSVAGFMTARLRRLAEETQAALKLGACIGRRFSLTMIARLREAPRARVAAELWPALDEGILVPASGDYRFFQDATTEVSAEIDAAYAFAHDRVQEAAYALLGEDERPSAHLRIGRLLYASGKRLEGSALFDVVSHLNLGRALVASDEERLTLARLNLEAAQRARASMAQAEAAAYASVGASLLGDTGWARAYDLCFSLHRELAECAALAGDTARAEAELEVLLARAETKLARAQVHELRSILAVMRGRNEAAVAESLAGLALLDVETYESEPAWKAAADAEASMVALLLEARPFEELVGAPWMDDPAKELAVRLLVGLDAPAIGGRPELHRWSAIKAVSLSLTHGKTRAAPRAYTLYGAHLAHVYRRQREAYAFVKLGMALHEQMGGAGEACLLNYSAGGVIHYSAHWRLALTYFDRAYTAGLEAGDFVFLSYTSSHTAIARLLIGDPLPSVRAQADQLLALMDRTRIETSRAMLTVVRQAVASLEGRARALGSLSDEGHDEAAFAEGLAQRGFYHALAWQSTARGMLLYLAEDFEAAVPLLFDAMERWTLNFTPEIRFFACLAALSIASAEERQRLEPVVLRASEELASFAGDCPDNYLHESLLVEAELARTRGEEARAMRLYDEAIEAATRADLPTGIALASEAAARFYVKQGRRKVARVYMTDAWYAYARWGAVAKLRQLGERYADLVPEEAQAKENAARPGSGETAADLVDLDAFLRLQQALSTELVLGAVLERLTRVALQNAGAERAALLLDREGTLTLEATAAGDPPSVSVGIGAPLDETAEVPHSIVRSAHRLMEAVILEDASADPRFLGDRYVAAHRPRSVACLAIAQKGRSLGVVYLENNAAPGVFTAARIEVLRLLLSQAAASIENAGLYARLKDATEDLRRANERLESEVARRTEELAATNRALSEELGARKRSEDERARLQEEIVGAQASRLAELSTPVIPITSGILVMPIIGFVDSHRAAQIQEAALAGVYRYRARIVLLDVTGMKGADGGVAGALVRTATTLRMLGAESVLSGVAPRVAREISGLGVGLEGVVVKATLEGGLAHALQRLGQRWIKTARRA